MRLIDASALRKSIETDRDASDMPKMWYVGIEYAINHIVHAPTVDAVEVVRCMDCARYEKKRGCNLLEGLSIATENCFCSYGERRDG